MSEGYRRKYPLNAEVKTAFIVVRKPYKISEELIKEFCSRFMYDYAYIPHENDISKDTGMLEGHHWHIVGHFVKSPNRNLQTQLNYLAKTLKCYDDEGKIDTDGLFVDGYDNEIKALQYLLHKNDSLKTQHDFKEIRSNYDEDQLYNLIMTEEKSYMTADFIINVVIRATRLTDIMKQIGVDNYNRYFRVIHDIWDERNRYVNLWDKKIDNK